MMRRCWSEQLLGLGLLLLLGSGVGNVLSAQDRGARRFGPPTPPDTVTAGRFDVGRLWSVATPPLEYFENRYGVEADSGWVQHLRRSVVRLPSCSGALVSSEGLALTTAECVRKHLDEGGADGSFIVEDGEERPVPGLYVDRLVDVSDVTSQVRAVQDAASDAAGRRQTVRSVETTLDRQTDARHQVEVVPEAGGTRYRAYRYRRYDDVRLVALPEQAVSLFGGREAALTYPRYALNVAVLRVYSPSGAPLEPDHYFEISSQGARPGDAVFSVGHPTSGHRAESHAQLAFRRDVQLPARRSMLETWLAASDSAQAEAGSTAAAIDSAEVHRWALKRTKMRLDALQNDYFMTRLERRDQQLRQILRGDPALNRQYGELLDRLARLQQEKRQLSSEYRAFAPLSTPFASATLRRALLARRLEDADGPRRDSLVQRLAGISTQPPAVDAALLATHIDAFQEYLNIDSTAAAALPSGSAGADQAASIVAESVFSEPISRDELRGSVSNALPSEDPALALVDAIDASYSSFRPAWTEVMQRERELTRRLGQAREAAHERPVQLPARRAPRLTDGHVRGYPYNGTTAPPFTTFYGMYAEHAAFDGRGSWMLPDTWQPAPPSLNRAAPLNLVASTDGAAGTDGAPLLNPYLELVGITFGQNLQGAGSPYLYLPNRMRTVSVDLRGLREALSSVYGAEGLVDELFGASRSEAPDS